MGFEIERKFLVADDAWRAEIHETLFLCQGYLAAEERCVVRVREAGGLAWLTLKGRPFGSVTPEFEYPLPLADARYMLEHLCRPSLIEKHRHLVQSGGKTWEIDEFTGDNAGLVVAEIELDAPDETISLPPWIGREVTGDPRYFNAALSAKPFRQWAR